MTDLVLRREEAADPAALPAGVGHEEVVGDTPALPGPLLAPRVLVMTPGRGPATGGRTGLLHEVEDVPAVDLAVRVVLHQQEVPVQLAGPGPPPLGAVVALVLYLPRSLRPTRLREPRRLGQTLIEEQYSTVQNSTVQNSTVQYRTVQY